MANLTSNGNGRWSVEGELVFSTVPGLLGKTGQLLAGKEDLVVDLGGVTRSDSAGLALMLEWLERCRSKQLGIRFLQVPQSLLDLARVSNVSGLLPLVEE